jgi:hypothetical protein
MVKIQIAREANPQAVAVRRSRPLVALTAFSVSVTAFSLMACQSVANLDVKYNDAGAPTSTRTTTNTASGTLADGGVPQRGTVAILPDAGVVVDPTTLGKEADPCPCDTREGLACCVSNGTGPICTTNQAACDNMKGSYFRCFGPDPSTESVCCLHRHNGTTESALAAGCGDDAVTVCATDADCPNSGKCTLSTCKGGVTIGACDANPVCPQ